MKSSISPMYLTYYMVRWDEVKQSPSEQKCTECGGALQRSEEFVDEKGMKYEGYICHRDKRVTWLRIG
jgi:tRNA U54 and U55 pseudouridine synthase Pus10